MTSRCLVFCFHCFCARSGDQEMIPARNIDYRSILSILQKPLKQFGPAASKYEQSKMEIKEQLSVRLTSQTSLFYFMLHVPLDSIIESVIAVGGVLLWVSSVCWDTQ